MYKHKTSAITDIQQNDDDDEKKKEIRMSHNFSSYMLSSINEYVTLYRSLLGQMKKEKVYERKKKRDFLPLQKVP